MAITIEEIRNRIGRHFPGQPGVELCKVLGAILEQGQTITTAQISDATAVGVSLMTAVDAAAARTAIDAAEDV